jgi:hypothetical protein
MTAYSLDNTAAKTLYKHGLNIIIISKKSVEISREVISSDPLSQIFLPHVFQSHLPFLIILIQVTLKQLMK